LLEARMASVFPRVVVESPAWGAVVAITSLRFRGSSACRIRSLMVLLLLGDLMISMYDLAFALTLRFFLSNRTKETAALSKKAG
jgi:hypothetical protein